VRAAQRALDATTSHVTLTRVTAPFRTNSAPCHQRNFVTNGQTRLTIWSPSTALRSFDGDERSYLKYTKGRARPGAQELA